MNTANPRCPIMVDLNTGHRARTGSKESKAGAREKAVFLNMHLCGGREMRCRSVNLDELPWFYSQTHMRQSAITVIRGLPRFQTTFSNDWTETGPLLSSLGFEPLGAKRSIRFFYFFSQSWHHTVLKSARNQRSKVHFKDSNAGFSCQSPRPPSIFEKTVRIRHLGLLFPRSPMLLLCWLPSQTGGPF